MVCFLFRRTKIQNILLIIASVVFYSWGGIRYCLLILLSTLINYFIGKYVKGKKAVLILGIIYNLGILVVLKYTGFLCETVNALLAKCGNEMIIPVPEIAQPIGISFFTFQILSYIIDVYYGKVEAQKSIGNLALYILMFPKIMSGPIVRYIDIKDEIEHRVFSLDGVYEGLKRFCIGFSKKVLLANQMALVADAAFNYEWGLHPVYAWIGALAYMLNIYLDFSAYSDMAIGLGAIFGFHFKENFNYPYLSTSIQEFWRRWHISLSSWFRDYVYIPLGGNRKGKGRTYLNLITVFFLTGLWHGASWNFIVWGLYHGLFMLIERCTGFCAKIPKWIAYIYSMFVVMIGWVFFRAENLSSAVKYIGYMFNVNAGSKKNLDMIRVFDMQTIIFTMLSILISLSVGKWISKKMKADWIKNIGVLAVFFLAICYMIASDYNPFIYFRF